MVSFGPEGAAHFLGRRPSKILAVGLNFRSHLHDRPVPEKPELFFKPPSSLTTAGAVVLLPRDARRPQAEGELAVVLGQPLRDASLSQAAAAVAGYTCALDITDRAWQQGDRQWWRAKGCDTWCPVGPVIVPAAAFNPDNERLVTKLDGKVVQEAPLTDMIFAVPEVLAFASRYLTLEAGDLLLMGTPGETPDLGEGHELTVEITGLGTLGVTVKIK
ncbi:MAG: fumarylacetoacetate hydrolase family protein [Candidatus Sericytochromatia bacterium]|nr:fumarylacetoacetate hydrolase family protein [Candidatus Sericytochromatia bacterium]